MSNTRFGARVRRALRGALGADLVRGCVAFAIALTTTEGCVTEESSSVKRSYVGTSKAGAGREGDVCAPGRSPALGDEPAGTCAKVTEYHVPNLTRPASVATLGGGLGARALRPQGEQAAATAATRASCAANAGPGIDTCGPNGNESCCTSAPVPAGSAGGLEVDGFDLGVYEVTSGRFAAFVAAANGDLRALASKANWPDWDPKWTAHLPQSRNEVDIALGPACKFRNDPRNFGAVTWPSTDTEAAVDKLMGDDNERAADIRADARPNRLHQKPINCVDYWTASAFCAWDGGRLPTASEWAFAAMGGDELRTFAWPNGTPRTPELLVTDFDKNMNSFTFPSDFPFFDNGMNAYHIAPPGRKPAGVARWGHHDMAGNLIEWTAENNNDLTGTVRGGSWEGHPEENSSAFGNYPLDRTYGSIGMRCAYGPRPAAKPPAPVVVRVPVHRSFDAARAEHRLELAPPAEGVYEGVAFRLLVADPGGGVPISRCVVAATGHRFVSSDLACEGQVSEGVLGFALATAASEMMPIFRCLSDASGDHLTTATPEECTRAGLRVEGLQGWVFGPPPSDYIASLYREGLGRTPEEAGHVAWTDLVLRSGGCGAGTLATALTGILTSPEFEGLALDPASRVKRLYRAGLGRDPDAQGGAAAEAALVNGTAWADLVRGIGASAEFAGIATARCSP